MNTKERSPEEWVEITLGSIIELNYGKSLPSNARDNGEYPVYGSNGIVGGHSEPLVQKPGLIVGRKGSFGEVQLSEKPFFPIDTTYFVNEFYGQPFKYWFYQLKFLPLTELNRSTAIPGLNREDAYQQLIKLPPLSEQKAIAEKLDTLLAQVETTKARLDRIPIILKRFRQSVLSAAVSGRLTESWRDEKSTSEIWPEVILKDAANIIDPHPSHRTPKETKGGIPYIGIGDLNEDGTINFEGARKVSSTVLAEHRARYQLKPGDFVFGKIGTLGKATSLPIDVDYTLSANVILIQPNEDLVEPMFLQYFLSAPITMEKIASQANSTSQAAFGIKKMRAFVCHLPPKEEQTEIVRRVEKLLIYAETIAQKANAALDRVNNLTQSILAKAFRGELTAEWREKNPKLVGGENSAQALLSRIRIERENSKPATQTRRKAG